MSGNCNNIFTEKYSNFQHGVQQCYKSNPTDYEQSKGSHRDVMFKRTFEHQESKLPSGNFQIPFRSNVVSHYNSSQHPHSQQQQLRMPAIQVSNSQTGSYFNNLSVSQQPNISTQTAAFSQSSSLQQSNASGLTRMCSSVSNQQIQNQEHNKMQFLTSNILPPTSQYPTNQVPVSFNAHQGSPSSHFSNSPSNLQQTQFNCQFSSTSYRINGAQQQSAVLSVPSSSNLHSNIPSQHIKQQQYPSTFNQSSQFPVYNQMPPNTAYQQENRSVPVSQMLISGLSNIPSNLGSMDFQQKTQLHQQSFIANNLPNQQQIQHTQFNVFTSQTGTVQPMTSITAGSATVTSVPNQQSNISSGFGIQTLAIPPNSLPSSLQNSSYHPPNSAVPIPGAQSKVNNNVPSFGPSSLYTVPTQHHFGSYQMPVNTDANRKSQNELLPHQLENRNLQPNAGNIQVGNSLQLSSFPPRATSMAFVGNQHSVGQQNNQSSEFSSQISLNPGNGLPSSQNNLHQNGAVIPSSQMPVPLPASASQCNLNIPAALSLGQSSNITFPPIVPMQQYFGNFLAFETSIDIHRKSQSEIDSEWVSHWLATRRKMKTVLGSKKPVVPIPEIRKLLHQASTFLKALSLIRDSLKSCKNDDDETWENKTKQALNIKHRLQGLLEKLLQPEVVLQLLKKLRKIKKKRQQHKKQREKRKIEKLEEQKRRLELHRQLDSYMETEKEKVLQAKREEELKKEADNILSEVRRKLQEGKRAQERLRVIEKLRQARKETAQKRGLHISEETDKQFDNTITHLKKIICKQLTHYDAEEKALKVMLETEQEGQLEQEEINRKEMQRKLLDKMQEEIKLCLFGVNDSLDPSDPLWYFRQYYTQTESSLEALMQTRCQWDMYLVPPTNATGSSIPISWIMPDPPGSDSWASALCLKECE